MTGSDEKRKHHRVSFPARIQVLLDMDGKEIALKGSSQDLSLRGIFVETDRDFDMGTRCLVKVFLAGGLDEVELQMQGTVVRQTPNGIGVEFNSMDVDTYSHLKNIVMYNTMDSSS